MVIRKKMSRIIYSFFQLDEYFHLSLRQMLDNKEKIWEKRLINFDISADLPKEISAGQFV